MEIDIIINPGDIVSIKSNYEIYKIKYYEVTEVEGQKLTCQGFKNQKLILTTYFKNELDNSTLEKYKHRNPINSNT